MKNHSLRPALVGLMLASAVVSAPLVALAQSTTVVQPAVNVTGKVMAQTDTTLTVGSRTITLTKATTFSRAGTAIGSGDVKVGDTVNIVTSDDGQVAVSVNVTASP